MDLLCPSLSLLISFDLKSILSNIKMAIPACFLGLYACNILFSSFYPEVMSISDVKVCFLDTTDGWILFLHPFCGFCYFRHNFGKLRPLMLRAVNEQCENDGGREREGGGSGRGKGREKEGESLSFWSEIIYSF